jgi:hypothetical protein
MSSAPGLSWTHGPTVNHEGLQTVILHANDMLFLLHKLVSLGSGPTEPSKKTSQVLGPEMPLTMQYLLGSGFCSLPFFTTSPGGTFNFSVFLQESKLKNLVCTFVCVRITDNVN